MLSQVLSRVVLVVALLLVVAVGLLVGRDRVERTVTEWRPRLRSVAPIAAVLAVALLFNRFARETLPSLSWQIGWNATSTFEEIEGEAIVVFQSYATSELTAYFTFIYVYGYVFLLVFPIVAYFALSNTRFLRELLTAYTFNYTLGLVCYVLVIAYGPRNVMPELLDTVLYDTYPQYQHLTREVNRPTNVFPSLHTSLATTVALFAYRTRREYPTWTPIATVLAASVAISTMYLAIHWAIDVVAGVGLAAVSTVLAVRLVGRWSFSLERSGFSPTLRRE